jgi:hypothetical protein
MFLSFKKLLIALTFNISLFSVLMIGIQNSSNQKKVNLVMRETVSLPISFIIGISFICGSISGSILTFKINEKK